MKKWNLILTAVILLNLVFLSCSSEDSTEPSPDVTPPTVSINNPANDDVFFDGDIITVEADVTDDENIEKVEFYVNGVLKKIDNEDPYEYLWETRNYQTGNFTLTAKAYDLTGNIGLSGEIGIVINLSNYPPSASIISASASNVELSGTTTLTCFATDINNDSLAYSWSATGGTINGTSDIVTWTSPANSGEYTLNCTVNDGEFTDTVTKKIYVAEGASPAGMLYVQGGEFDMGDRLGEGYPSELAVHSVTLSDYYIGIKEITIQQYCDMLNYALTQETITVKTDSVCNNAGVPYELIDLNDPDQEIYFNGTIFRTYPGYEDLPVNEVTWYGSAFYCNMESKRAGLTELYDLTTWNWACNWSGRGYRLPTEAEWEYAARGGIHNVDNYRYCGSNNVDDVSWYVENAGYPHVGGGKAPNQLGIYDMSGNVEEWVWDKSIISGVDYEAYPVVNPTGLSGGECRITRGGSCNDWAFSCRVSYRFMIHYPDYSQYDIGFRIVKTP